MTIKIYTIKETVPNVKKRIEELLEEIMDMPYELFKKRLKGIPHSVVSDLRCGGYFVKLHDSGYRCDIHLRWADISLRIRGNDIHYGDSICEATPQDMLFRNIRMECRYGNKTMEAKIKKKNRQLQKEREAKEEGFFQATYTNIFWTERDIYRLMLDLYCRGLIELSPFKLSPVILPDNRNLYGGDSDGMSTICIISNQDVIVSFKVDHRELSPCTCIAKIEGRIVQAIEERKKIDGAEYQHIINTKRGKRQWNPKH